jgi:anti-sigma factor RsiW
MSRSPHLQETRLFDCYVAVRGGERPDPPAAEHLADCADCAGRYAALSAFMDTVRTDADAEADEVFTPDRLSAQRLQIGRRLAHLGQPARVISFPGRSSQHFSVAARRPARRWIGAAAAAGLFIGVATGLFLDWETGRSYNRRLAQVAARQTVLTAPVDQRDGGRPDAGRSAEGTDANQVELVRQEPAESDEAFLSELERAGDRPRIRELIAVDALTPHVREVNLR